MAVNPIPEGHRSVTPYLIVNDADALLKFVRTRSTRASSRRLAGRTAR